MRIRTAAVIFAASCGLLLSAGSASAREATGLEGHWGGTLASLTKDEASSAEMTLDNYGCYAISIKKDPGVETGFYTVKNGKVFLKTTAGAERLTLEVKGETLVVVPAGGQKLPEGCCELQRR